MEQLVNTSGIPTALTESLDATSIKNLAVSVRSQHGNTNILELAACLVDKERLERKRKASFEVMKRHRVASRFRKLYPELPERFVCSLPWADLAVRPTDYMDNVPNWALGPRHVAVCGMDCYRRPFVGAKTTSGDAAFILARYSDDLSSAPRTGGDRGIFTDPDNPNEGSYVVIYQDLLDHCARRFVRHVVTMEGEPEDGDDDDDGPDPWGVD